MSFPGFMLQCDSLTRPPMSCVFLRESLLEITVCASTILSSLPNPMRSCCLNQKPLGLRINPPEMVIRSSTFVIQVFFKRILSAALTPYTTRFFPAKSTYID